MYWLADTLLSIAVWRVTVKTSDADAIKREEQRRKKGELDGRAAKAASAGDIGLISRKCRGPIQAEKRRGKKAMRLV